MSKFTLSTDSAKYGLVLGLIMIVASFAMKFPVAYDPEKVGALLAPLSETGWRLVVVVALLAIAAFTLRTRRPALAEWLGSFAVMALLYPLVALLGGFPSGIGLAGAGFSFGYIFVVCSLSVLIAKFVLGRYKRIGL